MDAKLELILNLSCSLDLSQIVLVGVSGGPDSLCLLDILYKAGFPITVACLNHGLRPESTSEVAHVRQAAASRGAGFISTTVDTRQYAFQAGLSIEEAARHLRYEFLFASAAQFNAQAVAVGHTADDQAETVLMNLLRGTGLAGLKGMEFRTLTSWSRSIPLVRPLLTTWRHEVMEYCRQHSLQPVFDATNQNPDFFRNRLRLEIIPYLEKYQPNLRQHLLSMTDTLTADYELLQHLVETAWHELLVDQGISYVAFNREKFSQHPVAVQRSLLRKAMLALRTETQDIERAMVERARFHLEKHTSHSTCDLGAGLQLRIEHDTAWVILTNVDLPAGDWPMIAPHAISELPVPGTLPLTGGWILHTYIYPSSQVEQYRNVKDPYQAWFDADNIILPLLVRNRRQGDRMQPVGMGGKSVKLSDLMINLKLPYRSRSTWPVVCSGADIIWVPGCRQSFIASAEHAPQRLLKLVLSRLPQDG